MDTDDAKRQGVQARIELGETEDTYTTLREALIERMYEATAPEQAWRMVTQLQALKAIRDDLMTKAANVDLVRHDEEMKPYAD